MGLMTFPAWALLHVPHDSTVVPAEVRSQFVLTDAELRQELIRMTDHRTHDLFVDSEAAATLVESPVSRLVVDVERFADDALEPMAHRGMGAVYTVTSQLTPLRRALSAGEREALMQRYYRPHHDRLEAAVTGAIERHRRCLVIDCHSFPAMAHPYEMQEADLVRPDICIGTDAFHTDPQLAEAFVSAFERAGWEVGLNTPFAGALVPASRYRRDARVSAVMVEVNRRLYLREDVAIPLPEFDHVAQRVRACCAEAIASVAV